MTTIRPQVRGQMQGFTYCNEPAMYRAQIEKDDDEDTEIPTLDVHLSKNSVDNQVIAFVKAEQGGVTLKLCARLAGVEYLIESKPPTSSPNEMVLFREVPAVPCIIRVSGIKKDAAVDLMATFTRA